MNQIENFDQKITSDLFDLNDSDNVCFLCGDPVYKLHYEVKDFGTSLKFKKCQCGLVKQTPMPNEKFFTKFFNSNIFFSSNKEKSEKIWGYDDYFRDEHLRYKTSMHRVNKFKTYLSKNKSLKILKIGPATGSLLGILKKSGNEVFGIDISKSFAKFALDQYEVEIENGRFEKHNYKSDEFDVIFLFNVIENVNNLDEFFQEIQRVLKPGGLFIFNFVDLNKNIIERIQREKYFIYRPPVCYIFTLTVINKVLKKYKLKPVKRCKDIRYMSFEKILSLLGWKTLLKLSTFFKFNKLYFPIYSYPSKIIVARKIDILHE